MTKNWQLPSCRTECIPALISELTLSHSLSHSRSYDHLVTARRFACLYFTFIVSSIFVMTCIFLYSMIFNFFLYSIICFFSFVNCLLLLIFRVSKELYGFFHFVWDLMLLILSINPETVLGITTLHCSDQFTAPSSRASSAYQPKQLVFYFFTSKTAHVIDLLFMQTWVVGRPAGSQFKFFFFP